jgi:hypothetical protein
LDIVVAGFFHLLLWPSIDIRVIRYVLGASHVTVITTWRTEGSYRKMMNFIGACVGSEGIYGWCFVHSSRLSQVDILCLSANVGLANSIWLAHSAIVEVAT